MRRKYLPDGTLMFTYDTEQEYLNHGQELYRTHGRHKIVYEGFMNDELRRIMRE